ncbi:MAG: hypothetical protein ACR2F2_10885 [Pyrinomonadaceae bacterium]
MALEFYLRLQTSLKSEEVINYILRDNEFNRSNNNDDGDFYGNGFIAWVYPMDKDSMDIVFEEVGIQTNPNIRCWHRSSEYEEGMRNILKIFVSTLKYTNGDAVIQLEFDDIKLIRKDGKIFLDPKAFSKDEEAIWRFEDIPFNYFIKELNSYNVLQ